MLKNRKPFSHLALSYYLDQLDQVADHWSDAFPNLPSYQRFVEPIPDLLKNRFGTVFADRGYVSA